MAHYSLISAAEAHAHTAAGAGLLVCAYDSDDKFNNAHLDGAIPLSEFRTKVGGLSKDQEIIFY